MWKLGGGFIEHIDCCFDTETTGLRASDSVFMLSILFNDVRTKSPPFVVVYEKQVDDQGLDISVDSFQSMRKLMILLSSIFNCARNVIAHNFDFDFRVLQKYYNWMSEGGHLSVRPHCTKLTESLLNGGESWKSLSDLGKRYDVVQKSDLWSKKYIIEHKLYGEKTFKRGKVFYTDMKFWKVPRDILIPYCARDVISTYMIFKKQKDRMGKKHERL